MADCSTCCGGCTEPTGGSPNCSLCSPDAVPGYRFCIWPAISGQGCLPGTANGCADFGGRQTCVKYVSDGLFRSDRFTIDCTTTYGVSVDLQWEMAFAAGGSVSLNLYAYLAGTNTLVATIVTYTGHVGLAYCDQPFSLAYSSDGGQCQNWPPCLIIAPHCCADCLVDSYGCMVTCKPCLTVCGTAADFARMVVSGLSATDTLNCTGCTVFNGSDIVMAWVGACAPGGTICQDFYEASGNDSFCIANGSYTSWRLLYPGTQHGLLELSGFNAGGGVLISSWTPTAFSCAAGATNTWNGGTSSPSPGFCTFATTVTSIWA